MRYWNVFVAIVVVSCLSISVIATGAAAAGSDKLSVDATTTPDDSNPPEPTSPTAMATTSGDALRVRADATPSEGAYKLIINTTEKGSVSVKGGVDAPTIIGADDGDLQIRAENEKVLFSANGPTAHMTILPDGRIGIAGLPTVPGTKLDVGGWTNPPAHGPNGTVIIQGATASVNGDFFVGNAGNVPIGRFRQGSNAAQGFLQWNIYYDGSGYRLLDTNAAGYEMNMTYAPGAALDGIYFRRFAPLQTGNLSVSADLLALNANGLRVEGNAHFTGSVTGANITAHLQDLAEWVPASEELSPGTVVVLNKRTNNTVRASSGAYDTSVAGVVSAQPGISLGIQGPDMVQVATTGRVKVRVDATEQAIAIGDLLVTSNVVGTAMRSLPMTINGRAFHQPGTLIGKALEPLETGVAEILVLLSLQ